MATLCPTCKKEKWAYPSPNTFKCKCCGTVVDVVGRLKNKSEILDSSTKKKVIIETVEVLEDRYLNGMVITG